MLKISKDEFMLYITVMLSLLSTVVISWFIYSLFSNNYLGWNILHTMNYLSQPYFRPDLYIYAALIPIMITLWNGIIQANYKLSSVIRTYPIMFMMTPFFLDNFYFIVNKVPGTIKIEIQFVIFDNLQIWQYQIFTVIFLIAGIITMLFAKRAWQVLVASIFTIAEFSSLGISAILGANASQIILFTQWTMGNMAGDIINNYFVCFFNNWEAYLGFFMAFAIPITILAIFSYFREPSWWNHKLYTRKLIEVV